MLGHRPISDPAELETVVAECVAHLDAGIRLFDRPAIAGDVAVELAGVDASGRLALILCDIVAGPAPASAQVSSPARPPAAEDARRATVLIERLERLRFSEVFR